MFALASALASDHISIYVTPYYNSTGPSVHVGRYGAGLSSHEEGVVVATVRRMKQHWNALRFYELYVGAIRLYDLGYRNEAVYWFYTAQYSGRLFAMLADAKRLGTIGDPAFELYHGQDAFFDLSGPVINGYAFELASSLSTESAQIGSQRKQNGTAARFNSIGSKDLPPF